MAGGRGGVRRLERSRRRQGLRATNSNAKRNGEGRGFSPGLLVAGDVAQGGRRRGRAAAVGRVLRSGRCWAPPSSWAVRIVEWLRSDLGGQGGSGATGGEKSGGELAYRRRTVLAEGCGGAGGSGVELWGEDGEEKVAGPSYRGDPGISAGRSGIMIPASSPGISGAPRSREGRGEEGADAWGRLVSGGARERAECGRRAGASGVRSIGMGRAREGRPERKRGAGLGRALEKKEKENGPRWRFLGRTCWARFRWV